MRRPNLCHDTVYRTTGDSVQPTFLTRSAQKNQLYLNLLFLHLQIFAVRRHPFVFQMSPLTGSCAENEGDALLVVSPLAAS